MGYSNVLITFFLMLSSFCHGCIPTPTAEPGPTLIIEMCETNKCPTLSGSKITVSPATYDPVTCVYTATAACDDPVNYWIKFNGVITPTYPGPKDLTCDETTMQYTYLDGGGIPQQITSIECACKPEECAQPPNSDITYSPLPYDPSNTPTIDVDGSCIYYITVYCVAPYTNLQVSTVDNYSPGMKQIQCRTSEFVYRYEEPPGMFPVVTSLTCF